MNHECPECGERCNCPDEVECIHPCAGHGLVDDDEDDEDLDEDDEDDDEDLDNVFDDLRRLLRE